MGVGLEINRLRFYKAKCFIVGKTYLNALGPIEKATGFIQMPLKKDIGIIGNARLA